MALINRFKGYYKATFVLTGNNQTIRTVANAMSGDKFSTPIGGLTTNYQEAGSTAYFNMLPNSKVIFADLLWTGFALGTSVEFVTPKETVTVTSQKQEAGGWTTCMADVTSIVSNGGSGKYECNKINGSMGSVGWFLMIVYENPTFPLRYLSYVAGAVNDGSAKITMTDIYTPKVGPVKANIFAGSYGSDLPDKAAVRVGPNASSVTQIGNETPYGTAWNGQKPYNPKFAFLSNIICNCDPYDSEYSLLDKRGTFGAVNSDPYLNNQPPNSRAWMDIGSMDISNLMTNGQTELFAQSLITGSGWYTQNLFALQVDINSAVLTIEKFVDKGYSAPQDEITYTFSIKNISSEDANNVIFIDTLPSLATFINGSFNVNGALTSGNPENGIDIGKISYSEIKTVSFKVKIKDIAQSGDSIKNEALISYSYTPSDSIPAQFSSANSNIVLTTIINEVSTITKRVNFDFVGVNQTITYTSVIKNLNTSTLANIVFYDSIPDTTTFIVGTVKINNISKPTFNPELSFSTGIDLKPNEVITITFDVLTGKNGYGTIPNTSNFKGDFLIEGAAISVNRDSNIVYSQYAYPEVEIKKSVDKLFVDKGDTIKYIFTIKNTGVVDFLNAILKDTIPKGTTFVNNSVEINGQVVNGSPEVGVNLPNIKVDEIVTLTFLIIVDK